MNLIKRAMLRFERKGYFNCLSDKQYLKLMFRVNMGRKLNLKNPKTYNEKLQWLKLYDRKPEYTQMVDKYEAKKYIAERIGEEYIIPTLGVWDKFDDIDFDALPDQFVLKCTHDSGGLVICHDKSQLDISAARSKLEKSLARNYYLRGREWPYKDVKPRIIAEQYITIDGESPNDYKFFCFDGVVRCFKIDYDRFKGHRANYYGPDGDLLRFGETVCPPDFERSVSLPQLKNDMIALAEKLSFGHPFLRVDFYEIGQQIYFGELTFFPASGFGPFVPEEWDYTLGSWIKLPPIKKEN